MESQASTSCTREMLEAFATRQFAFLLDRLYIGPDIVPGNTYTVLIYRKGGFGFEVELDWLDRFASVLLVRLETDGQSPGGYYVSNSEVVRVRLLTWLWDQGLFTRKRREPRDERALAAEKMMEDISFHAGLLEAHLETIERRAPEAFAGRD